MLPETTSNAERARLTTQIGEDGRALLTQVYPLSTARPTGFTRIVGAATGTGPMAD